MKKVFKDKTFAIAVFGAAVLFCSAILFFGSESLRLFSFFGPNWFLGSNTYDVIKLLYSFLTFAKIVALMSLGVIVLKGKRSLNVMIPVLVLLLCSAYDLSPIISLLIRNIYNGISLGNFYDVLSIVVAVLSIISALLIILSYVFMLISILLGNFAKKRMLLSKILMIIAALLYLAGFLAYGAYAAAELYGDFSYLADSWGNLYRMFYSFIYYILEPSCYALAHLFAGIGTVIITAWFSFKSIKSDAIEEK